MKKKVLMIIPNLGFGGAQRVYHDLSMCLSEKYEVIECVFNFKDGHAYPTSNKIYSLEVPGGKSLFQKVWFFAKRIVRLRKLKEKLKIDIAISHLEGADYVNILSRRNEELLLYVHGSKCNDTAISGVIGFLRRKVLLPWLYSKAHKIVAVSEGIRGELIQVFNIPAQRLHVINNALNMQDIDNKLEQDLPKEFDAIFQKPVLVSHGRLAPEKDHRFLIKLMSQPALKGKVKLVIIGDGPLAKTLVGYAGTLGHRVFNPWEREATIMPFHDVIFLGYQSNPFAFLKRSTVFVFPSQFEGFPMALLEAMACGLPIIARDCPYGPKDVLDPKSLSTQDAPFTDYGILISNNLNDDNDVNTWTNTINILITDLTMREFYARQSKQRAEDFKINSYRYAWLTLLSSK